MKIILAAIGLVLFLGIFFSSCKDNPPITPENEAGHVILKFNHLVEGKPLQVNEVIYENAAGNPYEINELMYFISDVTLHRSGAATKRIEDWKDIHYVEHAIPTTLT